MNNAVHCNAGMDFLQTAGTSAYSEGQESKPGTSISSDRSSNDKTKKKQNKPKQINFYSGESRINRNLFVSWSARSVDVMKRCLAQATVTIS